MRTYLEIGTSDFDTLNDKFADRDDWRGVSVEAVPEYFNRLRKHPKNTYVNAICSIDSADPVEFHYVPSEVIASHNLPQWLRGCGSMSLETQPSLQAYRPYVRTETLRRVLACDVLALEPFRDALTGACRIDLLKTDTEGYDFPLLNAILDVARPTNIIFETRFMSPAQFLALDDRLRRMGYRYRGETAIVCNTRESPCFLLRTWLGLPGRSHATCGAYCPSGMSISSGGTATRVPWSACASSTTPLRRSV